MNIKIKDISIGSVFYDNKFYWKVIDFVECNNEYCKNCKERKKIHFYRMDNAYEIDCCPYDVGWNNLTKLEEFIKEEEFSI